MTIRRSASIVLCIWTLVACAESAATTGHEEAADAGAVRREQPIAGDGAVVADPPGPTSGVAPAVALAGSIDGIRAYVASLNGESRAHGALRVLERDGNVLALAEVQDAALDAESRAWRGRSVRVLTSEHQTCTGHVAALELATSWVPKEELFDLEVAPSRVQIGVALDSMFSSVVAHVVLDGPEPCRGEPLLIHDAARPSPLVAHTLASVPRQRQVLAAFRKLPRYRALQVECVQHGECSQDEQSGMIADRPVDLRAFQFANDSAVYVIASLAGASCSDWGDPLSAIFVLGAAPSAKPTLYRVNEGTELGYPQLMLDAGGDGGLQLVGYRLLGELELIDEQGSSRQLWQTHFVGCGC